MRYGSLLLRRNAPLSRSPTTWTSVVHCVLMRTSELNHLSPLRLTKPLLLPLDGLPAPPPGQRKALLVLSVLQMPSLGRVRCVRAREAPASLTARKPT